MRKTGHVPPSFERSIEVIRGERVTLRIGAHGQPARDVCKVIFHRDGSIMLAFLPARATPGIVAECVLPAGLAKIPSVSLQDHGRVSSHLVKFTHHESGEAVFSQDGKVRTLIRRQSTPLGTFAGHLWTLQVQGLNGFRPAKRAGESKRDRLVTVNFGKPRGDAYKILGYLYPADQLGRRLEWGVRGPKVGCVIPSVNGRSRRAPGFLVGPPEGWTGEQRALLLSIEDVPNLTGERACHLSMIGAFDPISIAYDHSRESRFLALSYPVSNMDELILRIGTIDFAAGVGANPLRTGDGPKGDGKTIG